VQRLVIEKEVRSLTEILCAFGKRRKDNKFGLHLAIDVHEETGECDARIAFIFTFFPPDAILY